MSRPISWATTEIKDRAQEYTTTLLGMINDPDAEIGKFGIVVRSRGQRFNVIEIGWVKSPGGYRIHVNVNSNRTNTTQTFREKGNPPQLDLDSIAQVAHELIVRFKADAKRIDEYESAKRTAQLYCFNAGWGVLGASMSSGVRVEPTAVAIGSAQLPAITFSVTVSLDNAAEVENYLVEKSILGVMDESAPGK